MYAGVNASTNTANSLTTLDNDNLSDIPEWKKLLIMKKRAGNSPSVDEYTRRNPDSSANSVNIGFNTCDNFSCGSNKFGRSTAKAVEPESKEISPPKTVTIGNINVELRSVKTLPEVQTSNVDCAKLDRPTNADLSGQESDDDGYDLQYGPGIVDRLRAKFLNLGAKKQRKPVVRRFSSLENLPGSNTGPYRVGARSIRQNGFKVGTGNLYQNTGNVKKAQSMETLISPTPEQQIFASSRRPNARLLSGVKARILSKNVSPISVFADESEESKEKSPSPASSPRLFTKSIRRWDYNRSVSAPNINEDELPKPDTVKHVKKIFESPALVNPSEKSPSAGVRFRKIPGTTSTPTSVCNNGAIAGSGRPAVKKSDVADECPDAKQSAKEFPDLSVNIPTKKELLISPEVEADKYNDCMINKSVFSPVLGDDLSANRSCDTVFAQEDTVLQSPDAQKQRTPSPPNVNIFEKSQENFTSPLSETSFKATPEQLPLEEGNKHIEVLSQGSPVSQVSGAELLEDEDLPHPQLEVSSTADDGMVVAAAASGGESVTDSSLPPKKRTTWQKGPQSTTSIVFDFRGKDVKPNISLNPAPFGCRPAKVSRSSNSHKKRSGSPPRTGLNGVVPKDYIVDEDEQPNDDEDEEDWDEMDIGADLPAISGIVFTGENVKVGRGALLETRNKKLTIQFDDTATLTFEYPSEYAIPSPNDENGYYTESTIDIGSAANSRLGLSNYTPQVLTSSKDFVLGVSQPNHRSPPSLTDKSEMVEDVPTMDVIIPANPNDTGGWSATETADILF